MSRRSTIAASVFVVGSLASFAAHANCGVNPDATSPELRRALAGTWYHETRAPQLGMIQRMHQTFLPTGVWEYQDETCGNVAGIPCSKNGGHGLWMATRQANGAISIRIRFSDLRRTNACGGSMVTMPNPNTMTSADGGVIRRVR